MMKKIENKWSNHINGYLDAISDLDAAQREISIGAGYIVSTENNISEFLKLIFEDENESIVIKQKTYNGYSIEFFLEKLLLIKPFSGLYNLHIEYKLPSSLIDEYRHYIIFHLSDYIDFAYEEEGINCVGKNEIQLTLLKKDDDFFISLQKKIQDNYFVLYFFRKAFNKSNFIDWFDSIASYYELKVLEREKEKKRYYKNNENEPLELDKFTDEEKKKIEDLLKEASTKEAFTEEITYELSNFFSQETIQELKESLFVSKILVSKP